MRSFTLSAASLIVLLTLIGSAWGAKPDDRAELLKVREAVWHAWFAGDTKTLEEFAPSGTIVMSAGEADWKNQAKVLQSAAEFHAQGGKLVRLEFPRTEIQRFGNVSIIWSEYVVEIEVNGRRTSSSGRVTEVFVRREDGDGPVLAGTQIRQNRGTKWKCTGKGKLEDSRRRHHDEY